MIGTGSANILGSRAPIVIPLQARMMAAVSLRPQIGRRVRDSMTMEEGYMSRLGWMEGLAYVRTGTLLPLGLSRY